MNKLLTFLFLLAYCTTQAQNPQLKVNGPDAALVRLSQLKVDVKVVGNIAYTTSEMHFFNGTSRQMEAELLFPLPDGVSVSRYAIDINGKMREAVPVNKNKGKQVFEAVEHRRVDPGLLEKVEGNNFRTRIYPILPGKERIVIIGYQQELNALDATHLGYQMLSKVDQELDSFQLNVAIIGTTTTPTVTTEDGVLALEHFNQTYQASIQKNHYKPQDKLMIAIPIQEAIPSVVVQTVNNQNYFYSHLLLDGAQVHKKNPNSIGLLWDASLSCRNRDLKKELALLDAYFKSLNSVEVTLYVTGYTCEKKGVYTIKEGEWSRLKEALSQQKYDGGTRFSKVKIGEQDEYLFFTDGLSSLSANSLSGINHPLYTITSVPSSDYAFMKYTAMKTGGAFVNLNEQKVEEALNALEFQPLKFLGIKDNYRVIECYPMVGTPVAGSFSVAGISLKDTDEVTLLFGYGNQPTIEKTITINAANQTAADVDIEKLWAQKKIAYLQLQFQQNAAEIETLGKRYAIVTENSSLIVLESLNDYIQYEIIPPAELRDEYDRILKQQIAAAQAKKYSNWESVASYYEALLTWWNQDITYSVPKPIPVKPIKVAQVRYVRGNINGTVSDASGPLPGANVVVKGTTRATQTDFDGHYSIQAHKGDVLVFSFTGFKNTQITVGNHRSINVVMRDGAKLEEVVVEGYRSGDHKMKDDEEDKEVETVKKSVAYSSVRVSGISISSNVNEPGANKQVIIRGEASMPQGLTVSNGSTTSDTLAQSWGRVQDRTTVTQWNPDRVYLKAIAAAPEDKKYALYLDLREGQESNPSFYFDVAHYFYDHGNKATALLVLSNIADLGLENHQLYKSLTYVLRQWEAYEDALYTAQQVAVWRAQEPQAHRDLGLTLEDNKQYQAAFDELIKGLEVNYYGEMNGQYEGVEDIILMDINRMISEHKGINTSKLDQKYLTKMPVAVRIILNWNQMDTDIDLHVIEPDGEECFYGHRDTQAGARFSKDFTQGYGPEQYLLRNAMKGKYVIKTNFFGESTLTQNGPATVMVEIYTTKKGVTHRTLQTLQLGKVKENQNLAEITIE
jgi:uncharacterized protein YfaP (DUF2135 family)